MVEIQNSEIESPPNYSTDCCETLCANTRHLSGHSLSSIFGFRAGDSAMKSKLKIFSGVKLNIYGAYIGSKGFEPL